MREPCSSVGGAQAMLSLTERETNAARLLDGSGVAAAAAAAAVPSARHSAGRLTLALEGAECIAWGV